MTIRTSRAKWKLVDESTEEVILCMLTVDHASFANPINVVNNGEDIISGGTTFQAFPFELDLPTDDEGVARTMVTIPNADNAIGTALLALTDPPNMRIRVALASNPDQIEMDFDGFELRAVRWNALFMEGEITQAQLASEPWPKTRVTPELFPGIFAAVQ